MDALPTPPDTETPIERELREEKEAHEATRKLLKTAQVTISEKEDTITQLKAVTPPRPPTPPAKPPVTPKPWGFFE